jgi:hypothetical protein
MNPFAQDQGVVIRGLARAQHEENAVEHFAIVGPRAPIISFEAGE